MRNLKMTAVAAALVGGAAVAMAPTEAAAVASYDVTSAGTLFYGAAVNANGDRVNGNIRGQGTLTVSFAAGGVNIFNSSGMFSSTVGISNSLAVNPTELVTTVDLVNPTMPRGSFDFFLNYVGIAGAGMDGGLIQGSTDMTVTITLETAADSPEAFRIAFVVDPNFDSLLIAENPLTDTAFGFSNIVRDGGVDSRVSGEDESLMAFSLNAGSTAGGRATTTLQFNAFGFAESAGTQVIPVPAALPLLASALFGVGLMARRRRKAA